MLRGLLALAMLVGCRDEPRAVSSTDTFATPFGVEDASSAADGAFAPLPQRLSLDVHKVALGARLFRDRRLSDDAQVACSDCHLLERGGADGRPHAQLSGRPATGFNVPSIFNAAFEFRFGWGGGYEDIGQQLDFAMTAPAVMRSSWSAAAAVLARDPAERRAFRAVYRDGLTAANLRDALAFYSLSLLTPNARFDRYLRGELALEAAEQRGYDLFREYGCVSCHQGINVGGNMLQRFGVVRDYFADRGDIRPPDLGLFGFTGRPEDRHVFRVPSLRNVALTAPYFHDASAATLDEAVTIMGRYQLGRELSVEEAGQIAAFLRSLTGEQPGARE
jgi:cytochrome c peroxidase